MEEPGRAYRGGKGRPYPTHTPLGRIMIDQGRLVGWTGYEAGVWHRTMTEYLAGRKKIAEHHRHRLAAVLGVDPAVLDYEPLTAEEAEQKGTVHVPSPAVTKQPVENNTRAAGPPVVFHPVRDTVRGRVRTGSIRGTASFRDAGR